MTLQPTIEEFSALKKELQAALSQREKLASELRFVRVERDLFKERLDKMLRKFFAAKSEARGTEQKDMFFYRDFPRSQVLYAIVFLGDGLHCAA